MSARAIEDASLAARLAQVADLVTVALDELLPRAAGPERRLTEAMRYAVLGPGPRLRPFFALEAARLFGVEERAVLRAACAIECVHMAARLAEPASPGGRPTVAQVYDPETAALASEALLSAGFEIMADADTYSEPGVRADLVRRLAVAAGARGVAGGRMIERIGVEAGDVGGVARMQRMQSGVLVAFAVEVPLLMARAADSARLAMTGFAQDLALARRIARDLHLAEEAESPRGSFVSLLGSDAAAERLAMLADQCRAHLEPFGGDARWLRASVDFVLERRA